MRELVCHSHAIEAVAVAFVADHVVRVRKTVVNRVFRLANFLAFHFLSFLNLIFRLKVQIRLNRVISNKLVIAFRKLSALVNNLLYLVQVGSKVL